jgi:hypothetical protein
MPPIDKDRKLQKGSSKRFIPFTDLGEHIHWGLKWIFISGQHNLFLQNKGAILRLVKSVLIAMVLSAALPAPIFSQEISKAFVADDPVDSVPKGKLFISVDNLNFFKDNEYKSDYVDGNTLPGLWIRPRVLYYPDNQLRLELGGQVLAYHGRDEFRLYPWFSALYLPVKGLSFRIGNLNQDLNHGLAEPMQDSEHFLKDKPEAGIQARFNNHWLKTDLWIDWQTMIFTGDPYKEKFVFGTVAEFTLLDKGDKKLTLPLAFNGLHEGGEIDTNPDPAQTHIVVSEGIRYDYKTDGPLIKSGRLEGSFLQSTYPMNETGLTGNYGYAFFIQTAMNTDYGSFGTGYWQSSNFFTPLGMPLYQNSAIGKSETLKHNYLFVGSYRYNRKIFDHSQFGFTSDLFYNPTLNKWSTTAGLYLMVNLSFLCGKSAN